MKSFRSNPGRRRAKSTRPESRRRRSRRRPKKVQRIVQSHDLDRKPRIRDPTLRAPGLNVEIGLPMNCARDTERADLTAAGQSWIVSAAFRLKAGSVYSVKSVSNTHVLISREMRASRESEHERRIGRRREGFRPGARSGRDGTACVPSDWMTHLRRTPLKDAMEAPVDTDGGPDTCTFRLSVPFFRLPFFFPLLFVLPLADPSLFRLPIFPRPPFLA